MVSMKTKHGSATLLNSNHAYGCIVRSFHATAAILCLTTASIGIAMSYFVENKGIKSFLFGMHKSFGALVLFLSVLWLFFIIVDRHPLLPAKMSVLEKFIARFVHALLYLFLIIMPVTGWLMGSSAPQAYPLRPFNLFTMPHLVNPNPILHDWMAFLHPVLAWILITLIALHIAAALKHHFVDKDDILRRITTGHTKL